MSERDWVAVWVWAGIAGVLVVFWLAVAAWLAVHVFGV